MITKEYELGIQNEAIEALCMFSVAISALTTFIIAPPDWFMSVGIFVSMLVSCIVLLGLLLCLPCAIYKVREKKAIK